MLLPAARFRVSRCLQAVALVLVGAACSSEDPEDDNSGDGNNNPAGGAAGTNNAAGSSSAGSGSGSGNAGSGNAPVAGEGSGDGDGDGDTAGTSAGTEGNPMAGSGAGTEGPTAGTGSEPVGSPDWAMMGYDLGSTFYNSAETSITKENAATLVEAWTHDFGGTVYGAPLQVGDKIYANGPGRVIAFDAATGDDLWTAMVGSSGSLAFHEGKLYLNTRGTIYSFDAATGDVLWMKAQNPDPGQGGDGTSSPLVVGDLVVMGGSNGAIELIGGSFRGYLSGLDLATGDVKWNEYTVPTTANGAAIWSSPAADMELGFIYGSTGNNYGAPATDSSDAFIAFNIETGAIAWKNQRVANDTFGGGGRVGPDADFGANPVVYSTMIDGTPTKVVAAGNKGGEAHAVRADNGELLWSRSLCPGSANGVNGIFTNSTWTGKYLMVACNKTPTSTLYGLDGATGEIAWMRDLSALVWGRSAATPGLGYVGVGSTLEIVDTDNGDMILSVPSKGGTVASTITVAHGRVAFGEGLSWASGVRGTIMTVLKLPEGS